MYTKHGDTSAIQGSMDVEEYHMDLFKLSLGLVRIITSSVHFRKIVYVFCHALAQCGPIAMILGVVMLCYSALAVRLFQSLKIASETGNLYFSTCTAGKKVSQRLAVASVASESEESANIFS